MDLPQPICSVVSSPAGPGHSPGRKRVLMHLQLKTTQNLPTEFRFSSSPVFFFSLFFRFHLLLSQPGFRIGPLTPFLNLPMTHFAFFFLSLSFASFLF